MTLRDGRPPDGQQTFEVLAELPPPKKGLPRAADILIALVGLAVVSPLLAIAAIAIKLESRGPVLYRQRRVGKGGVVFEMFKLRTMRQGADPIGVGTAVTVADPRVTRIGLRTRFASSVLTVSGDMVASLGLTSMKARCYILQESTTRPFNITALLRRMRPFFCRYPMAARPS